MSDTTFPAIVGGTLGGLCAVGLCFVSVMYTACPNLFVRYFGWRTETVSFVPTDLRISTPKEHPMNVYRSNKQLTGSRRYPT